MGKKLSLKKLILQLLAALLLIGVLVFIVQYARANILEQSLSEQRNNIYFFATVDEGEDKYEFKQRLFLYDWSKAEVLPISYDTSDSEGLEDQIYFFGSDGIYSANNRLFTYESCNDLIAEFEQAREENGISTGLSFEDRKKTWSTVGLLRIEAYKDGFLLDSFGGVYCFRQDGETFEVSSFEGLPLVATHFLVGKNKDMILAVVRDEDDIYGSNIDREKAELYLYNIKTKALEKIAETTASNKEFCLNADGTRLAYFDHSKDEGPILNIYDVEKREIVLRSEPLEELRPSSNVGYGLQEVEFLTLLDTGEILAQRRDVTIGSSLVNGSVKTFVLISENGQTKAPKALQDYYITDVITNYDVRSRY